MSYIPRWITPYRETIKLWMVHDESMVRRQCYLCHRHHTITGVTVTRRQELEAVQCLQISFPFDWCRHFTQIEMLFSDWNVGARPGAKCSQCWCQWWPAQCDQHQVSWLELETNICEVPRELPYQGNRSVKPPMVYNLCTSVQISHHMFQCPLK